MPEGLSKAVHDSKMKWAVAVPNCVLKVQEGEYKSKDDKKELKVEVQFIL